MVSLEAESSSSFLVALSDRLDGTGVAEIRRKILNLAADSQARSMVMDLSGVCCMDTAGVALLIEVLNRLRDRDAELRVRGANEQVRQLLCLAGLGSIFETASPGSNVTEKTSPSDIIEVRGLSSAYGEHQVLHDVTFRIRSRQIVVIMGVSGCGKTTLLRHLIGLKPTPRGCLFVEGRDMGMADEAGKRAYRRGIGVLFQSGALFNSMTVSQNIAVPLKVHTRLADETIRIMAMIKLHMVGLSEFNDFMPSQLSGGMRKRAGLARALAMDPRILFVDEPSSGLDPITAAGLDELILSLREALGMTIIVVTHELESAFQIADHMIVLDQGRVLAAGSPGEVREHSDERVKQFLGRQAGRARPDVETYLNHILRK